MNGPIGPCRRNLKFAKRRSRSANQSLYSASVIRERNTRARPTLAVRGTGRAASSSPSPLAGEGGREPASAGERSGEGFPADGSAASAPSPAPPPSPPPPSPPTPHAS